MHNLDMHTSRRGRSERGFALILVILILTGMLLIGLPFAISMRLSSSRAQTSLANAHARYGAEGAYNHAIACLMQTQEQYDPWPLTRVRSEDTSFFESHTLDIPAELVVTFDGDGIDPDLDLTGELQTRNPRGTIWSVEVEDEQGKINLNSASEHLLKNLLYLLHPDIGTVDGDNSVDGDSDDQIEAKRKSAATVAKSRLVSYRRLNGGFHTVSEAESVLDATGLFDSGQLLNFSRYATVSSARPNPQAPHPINVNTAPQLVLVANMMGLRLATVQAQPGEDPDNVGNGSLSPIRISTGTPEEDWTLEYDGTAWSMQPGILLGADYAMYLGTIPFAEGDKFHFSTRRISEDVARDLAAAMQAEVKLTAAWHTLWGGLEIQIFKPDNEDLLGTEGHVAIGVDVMSYMPLSPDSSNYLLTNQDRSYENGKTYEARRIIAHVDDLTRQYNVVVETVMNDYTATSLLSALKLNTLRPLSLDLDSPTAPFCFTTGDIYTVTSRASVNDKAGNELAVSGLTRTVSLKRLIPIADEAQAETEGAWTIDTELAFDQLVTEKSSNGFRVEKYLPHYSQQVLSAPHNYRFEDNGKILLPSLFLAPRKLWDVAVHTDSILHFGGDVLAPSRCIDGKIPPLRGTAFDVKTDGKYEIQRTDNVSGDERGMFFTQLVNDHIGSPRLAYSTKYVPIPGLDSTCKSIEMWVRPQDWSDEDRNYFLFDITRPYRGVPLEQWSGAGQLHRNFDLQNTPHENRIALFYRGATKELIFRISDASISNQSAEVRYKFEPDFDPDPDSDSDTWTWHHVKAIWSGMDYGEMALLIDGKAPKGYDGQEVGTGRYHPKIKWRDLAGSDTVVITGSKIFEPPETTTPSRGTNRDQPAPTPEDATTPYGYRVKFVGTHTGPDPDDPPSSYFDRIDVYAGGVKLAGDSALAERPTTTVELQTGPDGNPIPIEVDTAVIPVQSTDGFQEKGFLLIGSEIVYYDSKTADTFICSLGGGEGEGEGEGGGGQVMRGVDIHSGGFGTDDASGSTGVSTQPQRITAATPEAQRTVVPISIYISENRGCPTPRYFAAATQDIGDAASFFGISSSPKNYLRFGDEIISYTHKPGTEFLVDVEMVTRPGGTMRGRLATAASAHTSGTAARPVYRVNHNGGPGGPGAGDRVTIIDDDLNPGTVEATIHTVSADRRYVSFKSTLPAQCRLPKNARMLKFPCGEFNPGEFFAVGTSTGPKAYYDQNANPFKMDRPAEATIDEFKISKGDGSIRPARLTVKELSPGDRSQMFILFPNRWDPEFDLSSGGSGVLNWPTQGYAQVGGEIIYYRTLYRHNVKERETGAGAVCTTAAGVKLNNTIGAGTITWTKGDQGGKSPEEAGFSKAGGYLTIYSYIERTWHGGSTTTLTDAAVQYLVSANLLDPKALDKYDGADADGNWVITSEGGYSGGGNQMEMVRYDRLEDGVFHGLKRGLMGTSPKEHKPVQSIDKKGNPQQDNEGNDVWYYPQLIGNIVELQIVQRGCLGTTPDRHMLGTKIMPLYHIISTLLTEPLTTDDDKLYVESNANFPHRGYLLVADNESQEVIGYTGKGYDTEEDPNGETVKKPYFAGVKYLRRRFGTPKVDLDFDLFDGDTPAGEYLEKGVVRLYEPRYDDRLPIDADTGEFASDTGDVNIEGNPAYLEITRSIRGARWESINWVEGPDPKDRPDDPWEMGDIDNARAASGTEIFILARVDGEPAWDTDTAPVDWSDMAGQDEPVIVKFDRPTDDPATENRLDLDGDRLELRIYFKYNENYVDAAGEIKQWVSPMLRGLKIGYSAPPSVYQQEEIRF